MFKSFERLDQASFWMWALGLIAGHIGLAVASAGGISVAGTIDNLVIIYLALALRGRFRDIGWPGWIGPTFVIGTMMVLPLMAVGIAIATKAPPDAVLRWITLIGLIAGPANLVLVVVAGLVPGKARAPELAPHPGTDLSSSPPSATEEFPR